MFLKIYIYTGTHIIENLELDKVLVQTKHFYTVLLIHSKNFTKRIYFDEILLA